MKQNKQLGEIIKSISITHKFDKNELIFLNTSDVLEGKILSNKYFFVSELKGQAKKTIQNNDILYSEIRPKNKRFAFVNVQNPEDYVVSTKLMVLRNITNDVDTKYIYYFLTYEGTINYLQMRAENRIGSFPQITFDILKPIYISLPKLEEQQKIANFLSSLDSKIELNNKINKELEAMEKTLYNYWFVQFDFPNENGKPYKSSGGKMIYSKEFKRDIPEGWVVKKLGDYAEIKRGDLITARETLEGKIKVVAAGINYSYLHSKSNREENTITISGSGANAGHINFWREPIFASDCTTVRGKNDIDTIMILNHLYLLQDYIYSQSKGSAQPHVYPEDIKQLFIPVAPDYLVNKFCAIVLPLNKRIVINEQQNQELAKLRDWLLPMLMNGQVRVK